MAREHVDIRVGPAPDARADHRVLIELHGITAEEIERINAAFRNSEHVHLADVFGASVWGVLSVAINVERTHMELRVNASRAGFLAEPVDKFGNHTA